VLEVKFVDLYSSELDDLLGAKGWERSRKLVFEGVLRDEIRLVFPFLGKEVQYDDSEFSFAQNDLVAMLWGLLEREDFSVEVLGYPLFELESSGPNLVAKIFGYQERFIQTEITSNQAAIDCLESIQICNQVIDALRWVKDWENAKEN